MRMDLIIVDLDGTLLNSQKQISPSTLGVIKLVRQRLGLHIVLATARPPRSAMPYQELLGLTDPMINYNGALVWDTVTGRVLLHRPIPVRFVRGIIRWARQRYPDIRVSAEIGDKWYTDFYDGTYQTETAKMHKPDVVAPWEQWLKQPVTKLLLLGQPDWLRQVAWAIETDIPHEVAMVQTEDWLLQIMHASVSKLAAAKQIAAELRVNPANVMAIGDNANDIGMIRWAGVGVAMGNSHPAVLEVADHITADNDNDGVARAITDLLLHGLPPTRPAAS